MEFVSEVDRKFYSNNLLSKEDWDAAASMDLSELLGPGSELVPDDLVADLPDDLVSSLDNELFADSQLQNGFLQDLSDSGSDSGISGISSVMMQYENLHSPNFVKQEPLSPRSPASSFSSESSETQILLDKDIKSESMSVTSENDVTLNSATQSFSLFTQPSMPISTPLSLHQSPAQINSILNSQVKIQPKPSETVQQKVAIPKLGTGKQLVLTPEEFKRLTSQGMLKFQNPTTIVSPKSAASQSPVVQVDNEIKALKRQQRMIKNRESASLSRKRKKEYMTSLEEELAQFTAQNQKLKEENEILKRRLSEIQSENEELRKTMPVSPSKKICLMAVFLIFSLNVFQFSDFLLSDRTKVSKFVPDSSVHKGRQLLSILRDESDYSLSNYMPEWSPTKLKKFMEDYPEVQGNNSSLFQLFTCPTYFNKTESVRLAEQLSGWMQSVKLEKEKKQPRKEKKRPSRLGKKLSPVQSAIRGNADRFTNSYRNQPYQIQVFDGTSNSDFWKSMPRRNDTFYVLSFSSDYFLVPATAHNKTMRPRMSLVMPAIALNDSMSPPPGNIGMMQIDCEVLNTQLIHVHKSTLPRQQWQHNSTYHDHRHP